MEKFDEIFRPGFDEIFKIFSDNPEYQNLTELLMTQDFQQLGMWLETQQYAYN